MDDLLPIFLAAVVVLLLLSWWLVFRRGEADAGPSAPSLPGQPVDADREARSASTRSAENDSRAADAPEDRTAAESESGERYAQRETPPNAPLARSVSRPVLLRVHRRSNRSIVLAQLRSRRGLRRAVLVQSIIGPPKALASEDDTQPGG